MASPDDPLTPESFLKQMIDNEIEQRNRLLGWVKQLQQNPRNEKNWPAPIADIIGGFSKRIQALEESIALLENALHREPRT